MVNSAQPTEADSIVARARLGDMSAFQSLYVAHRNDVAKLVSRMMGRTSDVDDVIQEVFVQVHRSLRDFRGEAKFTTWLHRVTVNVVLMHRRAARSRPTLVEEKIPDATHEPDQAWPDDLVEQQLRMRLFRELVERLAEKKRTVFVLHDLQGLSADEIAKIVSAPVLTVRTRLFYARRELEAMIESEPILRGAMAGANAKPSREQQAERE